MTGVVIVTGASRGIGAATARRAAQAGHAVVVNLSRAGEEAEPSRRASWRKGAGRKRSTPTWRAPPTSSRCSRRRIGWDHW